MKLISKHVGIKSSKNSFSSSSPFLWILLVFSPSISPPFLRYFRSFLSLTGPRNATRRAIYREGERGREREREVIRCRGNSAKKVTEKTAFNFCLLSPRCLPSPPPFYQLDSSLFYILVFTSMTTYQAFFKILIICQCFYLKRSLCGIL